jgi:hypothetical protein
VADQGVDFFHGRMGVSLAAVTDAIRKIHPELGVFGHNMARHYCPAKGRKESVG